MTDPLFYLTMATAGLAATAIVASAALIGWRGWLQLKAQELVTHAAPAEPGMPMPNAGARIEIADLKERIRKLEAIAAGVDL
jgi:hypothetical protein